MADTPTIDPSMPVDQIMNLSNLPYDAPKTPDKVSESQLLDQVQKKLYEAASYNPQKDPKVLAGQALQDKFTSQRLARDQQGMAISDERQKWMAENRPEAPPLQTEAPKFADTAKSVSPMLLVLMQLGGGAIGASAHSMLGALKGTLDATAQNNKDAFDRATDEWEKHWNTLQTNWKNRQAVYQQGLDWFAGRIDAQQKAAELAEDAAGVGGEMVGNALQRHMATDKLMQSVDGYVRAVNAGVAKANAAHQGHADKYLDEFRKTALATRDFKSSALEMKEAWDGLKAVLDRPENALLKSEINAGYITGASILTRLAAVDNEAVARFVTAAGTNYPRQLKNAVAGMPARMAGLKTTAEADAQAIPQLKNGWEVTDKAVQAAVKTATEAEQYSVDEYNDARTRAESGQFMWKPIEHVSGPQTVEPKAIKEYKTADELKAAVKSGEITKEEGIRIGKQKGWIK